MTPRLGQLLALVGTAWIVAPTTAEAYSGYTQPAGSIYAKTAFVTSTSNQFYDLTGMLNDFGQDFTQHAVNLYAEGGIWRGLQLGLNVPVVRVNSYANTNTAVGIGDIGTELKYGLALGPLRLAASVGPELPTGNPDAEVQTDTGLNVVLPTGDGELNIWSKLAVSIGLYSPAVPWLSGWASAGAGYNLRTEGFSDQIGWGAELGAKLWQRVVLQTRLRGQIVPSDEPKFAGFIFGEGTEFVSLGAGAALLIPSTPVAITGDWDRTIASRRNLYGGNVWSAGLSISVDLFGDR